MGGQGGLQARQQEPVGLLPSVPSALDSGALGQKRGTRRWLVGTQKAELPGVMEGAGFGPQPLTPVLTYWMAMSVSPGLSKPPCIWGWGHSSTQERVRAWVPREPTTFSRRPWCEEEAVSLLRQAMKALEESSYRRGMDFVAGRCWGLPVACAFSTKQEVRSRRGMGQCPRIWDI